MTSEPLEPRGPTRGDWLVLAIIVMCAGILGWPIFAGGYLTYADNPVHLAELQALAAGQSWSDIGFCGFPLSTLHSPLWFGGMAALVALGLPAGPLFGAFIGVATLAPPLALYAVARTRLEAPVAGGLAWLLLVQRTALVGWGSAHAGMATFYLAAAFLIGFLFLLSRPTRESWTGPALAGCLALVALSHFYVLWAAIGLGLVHLAWLALRRDAGWTRVFAVDVAAFGVAALASSVAWLPVLLDRGSMELVPQNLPPNFLLIRLLAPTDLIEMMSGRILQTDLWLLDAVPMVVLVGMGVLGLARLGEGPPAVSRHGALLVGLLATMLFVVLPLTNSAVMGPNSWRFLYLLRVGLALTAVGWLVPRVARPGLGPLLAGAALVSSVVLGAPLRDVVTPTSDPSVGQVQALWDWLEEHPTAGRVFVQTTFMTQPLEDPLVRSHLLSLSAHEAGVNQVGAYYGIVPYPTKDLTRAEFGLVMGESVAEAEPAEVARRLALAGVTRVVLADAVAIEGLTQVAFLEEVTRVGRFVVLDVVGPPPGWVDGQAQVRSWAPGQVVLTGVQPGAELVVKQSHHPGWRSSHGQLSRTAEGLLSLSVGASPPDQIALSWAPRQAQRWTALAGWLLWLGWLGWSVRTWRRT